MWRPGGFGGLLEFDRRRARRNMLLGYFDGKRMLYGLAGRVYYIDAPEGEPYYFDKMMSEIQTSFLHEAGSWRRQGGKTRAGVQKGPLGYRVYTEQIFPGWQRN